MCSICVDSFMFENGERYCHVVNKDTGEPLYYPNLYITTQVRNRSESISTMKVIAGSISLLYRFFMRKNINIDERIQKRIFLAPHEIEDLIEFTSFNFRDGENDNFRSSNVKKPTKYFRITTIANYLEWLCKILLSHTGQKDTIKEILVFINNIKRKKPRNNDKYNIDDLSISEVFDLILNHVEELEILYIIEGSMLLQVDLQSFIVNKGDIIIIPPNLIHGASRCNNSPCEFYAIVFHPSVISSVFNDTIQQNYLDPFFIKTSKSFHYINNKSEEFNPA